MPLVLYAAVKNPIINVCILILLSFYFLLQDGQLWCSEPSASPSTLTDEGKRYFMRMPEIEDDFDFLSILTLFLPITQN
jgi:hypothetical protein